MIIKNISLPVLVMIAVHISAAAQFQPGKVLNPITCKSEPSQTYALYIPVKGNTGALPVIYFFDAHGVGALPLNKYRSLADEYGFILIGSNNSKNGNDWQTAETIWRHLLDDTQGRLKINGNRIYTGGFSGGAKVASYLALKDPRIKGVIANGAGLPDGVSAGDFAFAFTAIAGEGDMNMTDLVAISGDLDHTRTRHRILLFDGKHEWAPENTMRIAFAGLQLDAMQKGLLPKDDAFIKRYVTQSKGRLASDRRSGQWIAAGQECKVSVSFLEGLSSESVWFRAVADTLSRNRPYQQQIRDRQSILAREQNTKAEYMQFFQQDNTAYWNKTIGDLKAAVDHTKSGERAMNQRLLAYLSLAFYSFSNRMIGGNENFAARHFVELYKLADPDNSEAWYFSAILHARDNLTTAAENDLLKAAETGFNDATRMKQQPEFKDTHPPVDLSKIERKMRALQK